MSLVDLIDPLKITLDQAQELVNARSNGGLDLDTREPGEAYVIGEWCLSEMEGLVALLRHQANEAGAPVIGIAEAEIIIDNEGDVIEPYGVTARQAREYFDHTQPNKLDGITDDKGGRVWLEDAIYTLAQIEALCVLMYVEAGDHADTALKTLAMWEDSRNEQYDEADNPARHDPY